MNGRRYTVDIDRLVLTDLDLTPIQAEQVGRWLAGELQTILAERRWAGDATVSDLERVDLATVSLGEVRDPGRLASALARRVAGALPGLGDTPPRG